MVPSLQPSTAPLDERRVLTWVYVGRLSTALALAIAATVVRSRGPTIAAAAPVVLVVVGVPLAWTLASIAWSNARPVGRGFYAAQTIHDALLVTVAILLTGGVGSEFAFLYVLLIAVAGLLLGLSGGLLAAVLCVVSYVGIAWMQIGPLLPLLPSIGGIVELPNLTGPAGAILWSLALTAAVFFLVGAASGLAGRRLQSQGARLEELEEQLAGARIDAQDILNTVESGIVSVNADQEIDFVNYTARAQLGIGGVPRVRDLRARDDGGARLADALLETLRDEHEIEYAEVALKDPAGKPRPYSVATTILYDPRGRKKGAAAILKDIGHVKRLEDLARQADRLKAVAELAAGLAHEIQNPLAAIRSSVELLGGRVRPSEAEDERLLGLVVRETDRLSALISDFMAFSRMDIRTRERIDLCDVVEDALEVERVAAGSDPARLSFSRPPRSYWVEGDYNLLKQVCLNLLTNAREAVRHQAAGRIEVRLGGDPRLPGIERAGGPFVALEVRDNGVGMPAEVRERIFDPFFTTRSTGFGMGLAIVHRIVDLHGGMVWVESAPGEGSTFRIALPRAG